MSGAPTYEQRLWLAKFTRKADWTLPEALAWIMYRDPEDVGVFLGYGEAQFLSRNTDFVLAVIAIHAQQTNAPFDPSGAVEIALMDGLISVQGRYSDGSGVWRPKPSDWQYLKFATPQGRRGYGYVIDESPFARTRTGGFTYYTDVVFNRESAVAAFPPRAPAIKPYWPVSTTAQLWVVLPATIAEARGRLEGSTRLGRLHEILTDMWNEGRVIYPLKQATFEKLLQEPDVRKLYRPESFGNGPENSGNGTESPEKP